MTLGGCGGGSGSGSAPSGTVSVSPIITTPAPSPSPTPSYETAFDKTRDQSFNLFTAELRTFYLRTGAPGTGTNSGIAINLLGEGSNLASYTAANQQFGIRTGGPYAGSVTFGQSDITVNTDSSIGYTQSSSTRFESAGINLLGPRLGSFSSDLRYVVALGQRRIMPADGYGYGFNEEIVSRSFISGVKTLTSDIPSSGTSRYDAHIGAELVAPGEADSFNFSAIDQTFQIDWAAATLAGRFATTQAIGAPAARVILTLDGRFDRATGLITATVTSPDGYRGNVIGRLYGPAGRELGMVFTLGRNTGERGAGTVFAVKY